MRADQHECARRRIRFLEPMTAVLVASRRTVPPAGLQGGKDGAVGRQWIEREDGSHVDLPNPVRVDMAACEVFGIDTPGGGGYGAPTDSNPEQ